MKYPFVNEDNMALLTDLYELTMAQVYFKENMNKTAVFDFYTRPDKRRPYLVSAGLEQLLYYLQNIRFSSEHIDFLKSTKKFSDDFLDYLRDFRFSGNVYGVEEGQIVFPNEPIVQIEAPLIEAQIIETFLINTLQISILIATKALRCYSVAKGTDLVDFGLRRAHGTDAGMKTARNSFIGGFVGTSNVLAGKEYNIRLYGTMAHSFILAFGDEEKAFEAFAKQYPEGSVFLVDTFDTIEGIKKAIKVVKNLKLKNFKGIRLDSGDILYLSKEARKLLDEAGLTEAKIFVSGGINEYKIKELLDQNAPIDAWGVGTELAVSADVPYLDCAYKLVEYDGKPKMKLSTKKITYPAKKQVFRYYKDGVIEKDILALYDEAFEGEKLLTLFIKDGKLVKSVPSLEEIRLKTIKNLSKIPQNIKDIYSNEIFLPQISKKLENTIEQTIKALKGENR
ncbi:MAG: nicotinate phosphoribosyltransferase [Aquificae bacterium]|nr:nicotinate phosphoribosyltransferase [Aquificota bacterium]